ncbi:amidohydrolase family protein, partial [Methanospirillum hungatei]|uniref:amidohydrolase family protein n=1 Tax=Methanospirillum hungatei TaxID=2203 RepID=UPI0026F336A6
ISFGFFDPGDSDLLAQVQKKAKEYVHTVRSWNNSLVTPGIGPHSIYSVTKAGLLWTQEFHKEHHTPIHIHLSETMQEVETCRKEYQTTPVGLLRKTGLLHSGTIAAHCCCLDEGECVCVGKEGLQVAHCPVSNLKLAVGKVMPYPRLKAAGAHVGLGTDGAASNNSLNMMQTMRIASQLQKFAWNDTSILSPGEVHTMATRSGAQALQLRTGMLRKGFPADIILMKRGTSLPCRFGCEPASQIQNGGITVDTTICNGHILMLHEYIPGEREILQAASNAAGRLMHEELKQNY